ncbi:TRAP transporter small permease [Rhodobacteraceae bacterium RKSG542]|uniref:TRAP transporter small permease n=1 Tax=Pseudovibrio flavus TaxID=2529854 RepID=UPI0012BD0DA9|nr:TRAP transporter small permease [Pseudovibrio flavus]MTI16216.1 TRAP transporter small permease [Pseudovibrio flavus]
MISNILIRAFRIATGAAFAVIMYAVVVQVFGRGVLNYSPVWTEELTRYALLFLAACGVGLSIRSGDLVNVDIVINYLPDKARKVCLIIAMSITAFVCFAMVPQAWLFTSIGAWQTSPATNIRMDIIHFSMVIFLGGIGLFAVLRVIELVKHFNIPGLPEHNEGDEY